MKKLTIFILILFILLFLISCSDGGSSSTGNNTDNNTQEVPDNSDDGDTVTEKNCNCGPLEEASGNIVTVKNYNELVSAVSNANTTGGNVVIIIEPGTYNLENMFYITSSNIIFRGKTGNRDDVILKGKGMSGNVAHVFLIAAKNIMIADLTLGWVKNHGIQIQGENDADDVVMRNLRIVDTGEQMVKVSKGIDDNTWADRGVLECSLLEYSAGEGPQYYIGGIDCHKGKDWIVRDNTFKNIKSPESLLAEHAIHFWSGSSGTIVERNIISNCDRGIGFGLGSSTHSGGVIKNNFIYTTRDVGIGLESANDAKVYYNTIVSVNYSNAIEYRFSATTGTDIKNNLTSGQIASRNGGSANLSSNITTADWDYFVGSENDTHPDLHLNSGISGVKDMAETISGIDSDIDCNKRSDDAGPDIGADEYKD